MSGPIKTEPQKAAARRAPERFSTPEQTSLGLPLMPLHDLQTLNRSMPSNGAPNQIRALLGLQRSIGNRATGKLLQRLATRPIQSKLTVGPAGDRYEREADAAADRVAAGKPVGRLSRLPAVGSPQRLHRQPETEEKEELQAAPVSRQEREEEEHLQMKPGTHEAQRTCPACKEEAQRQVSDEDEAVQTKSRGGGPEFDMTAAEMAMARSSSGQPLAPNLQGQMKENFGTDFSAVRVHTGTAAAEANRAINARAFTHGSDIYLGRGESATNTRLMAHELTHVVQQESIDAQAQMDALVQRDVDPRLDVDLVGHASPRWEHTHGATAGELNIRLSQDRVDETKLYFREIFNRRYGDLGAPAFDINSECVDVQVDELPSVTSEARGSEETLLEAGHDATANDPMMRRVNIAARVTLFVRGMARSSEPVTETTVDEGRTRRWAVAVTMTLSAGEGVGGAFAMGILKNRATTPNQTAPFYFGGSGGAGGLELPIPAVAPFESFSDFTTNEPLTFEDFNGRFARLTDLSIGVGVAGYSAANFWTTGMPESVYVGGFVMNEWGVGGASVLGAMALFNVPSPITRTRESVETVEEPYEFTLAEDFEHVVTFDTGSASISDRELTGIENYVDRIIEHIQMARMQYADE